MMYNYILRLKSLFCNVHHFIFHLITIATFNELYHGKNQVELSCDDSHIYAVAAKDTDGCVMISNPTAQEVALEIFADLSIYSCKLLDEKNMLSDVTFDGIIPPESVMLLFFK